MRRSGDVRPDRSQGGSGILKRIRGIGLAGIVSARRISDSDCANHSRSLSPVTFAGTMVTVAGRTRMQIWITLSVSI